MLTVQFLFMLGFCMFPALVAAEQPSREGRPQQYASYTVSADWLRNIQSKATRQSINRARRYSAAGEHMKAIETLKQIRAKGNSAPYLSSLLGFEYLQVGQAEQARTELAAYVRMLPNEPIGRSNFALALYAVGEYDRAFQEITQALALAPGNHTSELILRKILRQ
jgi:Flp pilus assembly protein TadD